VQQKEGRFRYLRRRDFANDAALMQGLAVIAPDANAEAALDAALGGQSNVRRCCVSRSIVAGAAERLFFINAEPGRAAREDRGGGVATFRAGRDLEILPSARTSTACTSRISAC